VDLAVSYSLDSSSGNWFFGLNAAIIQSLERSLAPGLPSIDVLDTFGNPVDDRARFNLGWRRNAWSVNAFVNYVGGYTNTAITPNVPVDSYKTVDASLDYAFDNGLSVSLSGQNLLDEDPPIVLNGTVSWDSQNASAIGRFLAVGITKSW
jgi:iron complex outermembrane recepter protein